MSADGQPAAGESDWQITWRQFKKNPVGIAGLVIVYLLFAIAVICPLVANGLPYRLRGVVTHFFDSDVTAWRNLGDELIKLRARRQSLEANSKDTDIDPDKALARREELAKIQASELEYQTQMAEALDRVEEVLGREARGRFKDLRGIYDKADQAAWPAARDQLDELLCEQSYGLLYKAAVGAALDIEEQGLRKLRQAVDDYIFAQDDEDEEAMASQASIYAESRKLIARRQAALTKAHMAMASFLDGESKAQLGALSTSASKALLRLPDEVPSSDSEIRDSVDEFKDATAAIDSRFSRIGIDPRLQRLPVRTYWPAFRYMIAMEVSFLVLFLTISAAIIAGVTGLWPKATPGKVVALGVTVAVLAGIGWRLSVTPRNPPPVSYYKRYFADVRERQREYAALRARGQSVPDAGSIALAPVPFGENENITIDAKAPPTWAESFNAQRRRLLSAAELKTERSLWSTPPGWIALDDKGQSIAQPAPRNGGLWRLPGRLIGHRREADGRLVKVEAADATVQVFSMKGAFKSRVTGDDKKAWLDLVQGRAVNSNPDTRESRFLLHSRLGSAEIFKRRGPSSAQILALFDERGEGIGDGPWAIEMIGDVSTVDIWEPNFEMFVASVKSRHESLIKERLTDPNRYHWLGTDENGRDVLARMIYGSRISLSVGFIAVGIYVILGIVIGSIAGFFGGWTDIAISRVIEIVICFPSFFLIITVLAMFPPSIMNIMVVIGLTSWTGVARLIRGEFLRLVNLDFVIACRALGFSPARTIFRHVVPNALAPVLVAATFGVAGAILTESALSYLGFGVPQPAASWGSILQESAADPKQLWWITVFPGLAIFITITAYNIVGEAFRDASDPKLRK